MKGQSQKLPACAYALLRARHSPFAALTTAPCNIHGVALNTIRAEAFAIFTVVVGERGTAFVAVSSRCAANDTPAVSYTSSQTYALDGIRPFTSGIATAGTSTVNMSQLPFTAAQINPTGSVNTIKARRVAVGIQLTPSGKVLDTAGVGVVYRTPEGGVSSENESAPSTLMSDPYSATSPVKQGEAHQWSWLPMDTQDDDVFLWNSNLSVKDHWDGTIAVTGATPGFTFLGKVVFFYEFDSKTLLASMGRPTEMMPMYYGPISTVLRRHEKDDTHIPADRPQYGLTERLREVVSEIGRGFANGAISYGGQAAINLATHAGAAAAHHGLKKLTGARAPSSSDRRVVPFRGRRRK